MAREDNDHFHFNKKNYFLRLKSCDNESHELRVAHLNKNVRHALEHFVDDLKLDQNQTIDRFLNEQSVNDIYLFLAQLLLCDDDRTCGNSAYIIGSIIETDRGFSRFLSIFDLDQAPPNTVDIVQILCDLLTHQDPDCVLNATGTLGTISGSKEGRDLILKNICAPELIQNATALLCSSNVWISSNAALVIARLTVDEIGCQIILTHDNHREILNQLLAALDISDSSRSTNVAFAIARLIEGEDGKKILINDCGRDKFFEAILIMLEINEDKGINKNACYALSCLCSSQYGFELCVESITLFHRILIAIETILLSTEHEAVWFALMCLTTIAKHDGAFQHLSRSKKLLGIVKQLRGKWQNFQDVQDELRLLWFLLNKYIRPNRPRINECRTDFANVSWDPCTVFDEEDELKYRVILNDAQIVMTTETHYCISSLNSNTTYNVMIQYVTKYGDTIQSNPTVFQTDEEIPPPVMNLRAAGTTITSICILWDAPDLTGCSSLSGYQIYLNDAEYEITNESGITISSLTPDTVYQIDVCIITQKRRGPRVSINVKTDSAAPPTFSIIGRRELHIKWQTPEFIPGHPFRCELLCNGRCVYAGVDQEFRATKLRPDTEYKVAVIITTNEGRFRSPSAKIRTLKDEFPASARHSLVERPTPVPPRSKRAETTISRKISPSIDRRLTKEVPIINQNVQITTVRSVQLKTDNLSYSRALPGLVRNFPARPTRTLHRSKTELPLQQLSAAVIIPTLNIHSPSHNSPFTTRMNAYRYQLATRTPERSPSSSLRDASYNLRRVS